MNIVISMEQSTHFGNSYRNDG